MKLPSLRLLLAAVAALVFGACSSGTRVVVIRPAPSAAVPAPAPTTFEPLEVAVARPVGNHIYLQTNRPAYVAIFEIIPGRGVAMVHPGSPRESQLVVSGLTRVPIWWSLRTPAGRGRTVAASRQPVRYIYALASDRPLRLTEGMYDSGQLQRALGVDGRPGTNPYVTMRALARRFVTVVREDQWAEDVYLLDTPHAGDAHRVARVYCGDGTVYEVPAEMADRVWCPTPQPAGNAGLGGILARHRPTRPDSVKGENGRPVAVRPPPPRGRGPGSRVTDPVGDQVNTPADVDTPQRVVPVINAPVNAPPVVETPPTQPVDREHPGQQCRPQTPGDPPCRPITPPGRPADAGRPENPGRPDDVGPPANTGRPETAGNPAQTPPATGATEPPAPAGQRPATPPSAQGRPANTPPAPANQGRGQPEATPAAANPPAVTPAPAQAAPPGHAQPPTKAAPAAGPPGKAAAETKPTDQPGAKAPATPAAKGKAPPALPDSARPPARSGPPGA
ncbi:MAG TPA: hypothetical protein VMM18_09945 [Gemmatimonadaceae bacterium]|nr:hypothetical protein [Gemmatimonadaceae bacterium]